MSDEQWQSIIEISYIRQAIDGGMKHDLVGFGKFAVKHINTLQSQLAEAREEVERRRLAQERCVSDAVRFGMGILIRQEDGTLASIPPDQVALATTQKEG